MKFCICHKKTVIQPVPHTDRRVVGPDRRVLTRHPGHGNLQVNHQLPGMVPQANAPERGTTSSKERIVKSLISSINYNISTTYAFNKDKGEFRKLSVPTRVDLISQIGLDKIQIITPESDPAIKPATARHFISMYTSPLDCTQTIFSVTPSSLIVLEEKQERTARFTVIPLDESTFTSSELLQYMYKMRCFSGVLTICGPKDPNC